MLIADFGTSYVKLLDTAQEGGKPRIIPTRDFDRSSRVDIATGHNGRSYADYYINELTALARGGERLIRDDKYTLLDCGSRDIKYVRYENGQVKDMGWNAECGASMGFTIELLEKYYDLDFSLLTVPPSSFSVTCGVLGMSHIFDAVVNGQSESEAVARFVKGIALNAYNFAGKPEKLYLSGGLCANPLFIQSFPCKLLPLGRFVLLEGLKASLALIGDRGDRST
jgi:activator of 2-hydroxyglutaryl-CoA dehydratase